MTSPNEVPGERLHSVTLRNFAPGRVSEKRMPGHWIGFRLFHKLGNGIDAPGLRFCQQKTATGNRILTKLELGNGIWKKMAVSIYTPPPPPLPFAGLSDEFHVRHEVKTGKMS